MTIAAFKDAPRSRHRAYSDDSTLVPAAPEYTTGDILSGSLDRALLLGIPDSEIDLGKLATLPAQFGQNEQPWTHLIGSALRAPPKAKGSLADVIPVVPQLSARGAVIGAPRNRWRPGKFALAALEADAADSDILDVLAAALAVDDRDELAAVFLERELKAIGGGGQGAVRERSASFWRRERAEPLTPGERLASDMRSLVRVKHVLPRYQWYVLMQATLRLGVPCYQLWLCMLHEHLWRALCAIVDEAGPVTPAAVIEREWCTDHAGEHPLLELGENATDAIKAHLSRYAVARVGINLVLHALDDCGDDAKWETAIGSGVDGESPAESLERFMEKVSANRARLLAVLGAAGLDNGLQRAAQQLADADPDFVSAEDGATNNLREFLRHTLGRATRKKGDFEAFDQGFVTRPTTNATNAPQMVYPGSTTLVALAACTAMGGSDLPASMQDLSLHLREYGVYAPLGTLTEGRLGRELEELGLTVDTPDAGGGRLLVNPFSSALVP